MSPVAPLVQNPLTAERDSHDREALYQLFPTLRAASHDRVLALRSFLKGTPERWFDRAAYAWLSEWLSVRDARDRQALQGYLVAHDADLNRAFLFLREINRASWHQEIEESGGEYDLMRLVDRLLHPTYLRLVEGVLIPLVRVVAHFSRLDRGVGTEGLDVWPVVEELQRGKAALLVDPYRHVVRNGIAHGGVTYLQNEIRYRDKRGNEETLWNRDIIRTVDDLVDVCNGVAAAMKAFLVTKLDQGYGLPREVLVEELREETETPWWIVEGCVESEIGDRSQLLVYARANSRDSSKVQYSAIQTGILAESIVPGYDRYFVSLRSDLALPGWAAFDGQEMRLVRDSGPEDVSAYSGVVENGVVFYVPRRPMSRVVAKFDTYREVLRVGWPQVVEDMRRRTGAPHLVCRYAKMHRNSWGAVLTGGVIGDDWGKAEAHDVVHRFKRRILAKARRAAALESGASRFIRRLPLAFAQVAVYRRDYRARRLASYGLGEDLICTVRFQRMRRIKSPDIMDSTVEVVGRWRIAWNRAWLDEVEEGSSPGVSV